MAFNSARNSLFLVGHDQQQQVAEIAVPEIRKTAVVDELATATVLQPFVDAAEGHMAEVGGGPVKVGGMLPYQGKLILTAYVYYDGDGTQQLSHFVSGMDLSVLGDVHGPYHVGSGGAGMVAGYFCLIPAEWQERLGGPVLNGQGCIPIISRTSFGPAAFAIDPAQLGKANPLPAQPLVYYPLQHPTLGAWGEAGPMFNGTTELGGVVFPDGTDSVLFFGRHGVGKFGYGLGTSDPAQDGAPVPGSSDLFYYDPSDSSKGPHGYPYKYFVWAYNAHDLAAVKQGKKQPWDVVPYATWTFDLPTAGGTAILGATRDPATGRIFISQNFADGALPLIHVLAVEGHA